MAEINGFNLNNNENPNHNDANERYSGRPNGGINNQGYNGQLNEEINNQGYNSQLNGRINNQGYNGQPNEGINNQGYSVQPNEGINNQGYNSQINGDINNQGYNSQINGDINNQGNNGQPNGGINNQGYNSQINGGINNQGYSVQPNGGINNQGYNGQINGGINNQGYNGQLNGTINSQNYGNPVNFDDNPDSTFNSNNYVDQLKLKEIKNEQKEKEKIVSKKNKKILIIMVIIIIILFVAVIGYFVYSQIMASRKAEAQRKNRSQQENAVNTQIFETGTDVTNQVGIDTEKNYTSIDEVLNKEDPTSIIRGVSVGVDANNQADKLVAENLGWEVLKDNGDTVDLIAIKSTDLKITLSKSSGYNNGVKALNEICNTLYGTATVNGNKVISARSANFEDFYSDSRSYEDYTYTTNNKYPISLDHDNEDYRTGWSSQTSYYMQPQSEQSVFAQGSLNIKSNQYDGEANKNTKITTTGKQYWLASRCVYAGVDACNFGIRRINESGKISYWPTFSSDGKVASPSISLRPVLRISKDKLK